MIKVLYFARLRETLNSSGETLETPTTVADLKTVLAQRGDVWKQEFTDNANLLVSVNQDMANTATPLKDGDEVGFFPPVTGG